MFQVETGGEIGKDGKGRPRIDEGVNQSYEEPLEIVYITDVTEKVPVSSNQKGRLIFRH